ncbi:unnamed protein product [Diatraea saccharalis]|uniref:DUF2428 domain-containing protein n=1 Tax=Diatraea saccharalis TaxID=40085 RepID=A0A9N9WBY8_9NEOP|nr:unnamed protein product [Diatraea saccharalis]
MKLLYSTWRDGHVSALLRHVQDGYERNRDRALALLARCPPALLQVHSTLHTPHSTLYTPHSTLHTPHSTLYTLHSTLALSLGKKYSVSIELEDILRQASSLKPADTVSAAYKLILLKRTLPEYVLETCQAPRSQSEPVSYALLHVLLRSLEAQLQRCSHDITAAPTHGPLYGTLHCIRHVLQDVPPAAVCGGEWGALVSRVIEAGVRAGAAVDAVVNCASPEGHLPARRGPLADHGNSAYVHLAHNRLTAPELLLCNNLKENLNFLFYLNTGRTVRKCKDFMFDPFVYLLFSNVFRILKILALQWPKEGDLAGRWSRRYSTDVTAVRLENCKGGNILHNIYQSIHRQCRHTHRVSLLLGSIVSRLSIQGEGQEGGILSQERVFLIGDHFTKLLTETKHRGAFEQAYVGFTEYLSRLWRCRVAALHAWGGARLRALLRGLAGPALHPTRRSAGLPFIVQALVITELQVKGNPTCLHQCMNTLLRLVRATSTEPNEHIHEASNRNTNTNIVNEENKSEMESSMKSTDNSQADMNSICNDGSVESRTHCMNILRALFRNSELEESLAGYIGEGLMVALAGFEKETWMERNAATLLFSALLGRVCGPARTRARRTLFLRYPTLCDYIAKKLEEAGPVIEEELNPGLFPVLLVVGRLGGAAPEGAGPALPPRALAPPLRAPPAPHRAAAAAAARALLPPARYIPHIESLLDTISSSTIKRNHCHGILLQLTNLLAAIPEGLVVEDDSKRRIARGIRNSSWILIQGTAHVPCYLITDEYVKMINLIIWRRV